MKDLEIQLARAEQELLADETALHTELERMQGLIKEFVERLEAAKDNAARARALGVIDTVLAESINRVTLRPIDADGIGARAREARDAAVRARRDAANHLRHSITAWKSSYKAITHQLTTDEKSVQRALASKKKVSTGSRKAYKPEPQHEKPGPPVADDPPRITSLMYKTQLDVTPPSVPGLGDDELDIQMATGQMFSQSDISEPVSLGDDTPTHTASQFAPSENRPRRSRPRVHMQTAVKLKSGEQPYQGFAANVSDGGIFVLTDSLVPVGTELTVTFTLEGKRIDSRGIVKWVRRPDEKSRSANSGIGIEFLDISEAARQLLQRYVSQREPLFFDEI